MKSKILLLIFAFLLSNTLSCENGKSQIVEVLESIIKSLPELQKQAEKVPECQTSELKPVCSKGYRYWSSHTEERLYKGVSTNKEDLNAFFSLILSNFNMDQDDKMGLLRILSTMRYSDYIQVIGIDVLYSRSNPANNKGMYFSIFAERNCKNDDEIDFLYTGINSEFKLSKDVFILEECSGGFLRGTHCDKKHVDREADLSREQYNALLTLLQVSVYSKAAELVEAFKD